MATGGRNGASGTGGDDRAARLAEALRRNLHRRKAQARARRHAGLEPDDATAVPPKGTETGEGPGESDPG